MNSHPARLVMKLGVVVLLVSFVLLSACADREPPLPAAADGAAAASAETPPQPSAAPAVTAPTTTGAVAASEPSRGEDKPVFLDVRTPAEYDAGHVAGSLHIPLEELDDRWQELAPFGDRPIVVYCRTGRRSAAAIGLLRSHGFDRLENGGGLTHMAARGLPLEPPDCC